MAPLMAPSAVVPAALLPLLSLLLVAPTARQADDARVLDQVAVRVRTPAEAALLAVAATDIDSHFRTRDGSVVIYADDAEQQRLRRFGLELVVIQEDLASFYAQRAADDAAPAGLGAGVGSMGGFRTLSEVLQKMDELATNYPTIVSPKYSIGTTVEGRPIWAMRVSDNPAVDEAGEPVAWFDALHHAREPMSGESLLMFAEWLAANYPTDPMVKRVVESRNVVFVPVVNPDGYAYNEQTNPSGGGLWRKNRRDNGNSFGVDLNRNYDWEWGTQWPGGSSSNTFSDIYRGPSPFSEPETRAVRDATLSHPPGMHVSSHCASNLWLFPWGYASGFLSPLDDLLRHYATGFVEYSGWPVGTPWQVLSSANGTTIDWAHGVLGNMAYTPEIGSSATDGFWPAPSRIPALFEDVRPGYLKAARFAGGWADELAYQLVELIGDGDESIEADETWEIVTTFSNLGFGPVQGVVSFSSPSPDIIPVVVSAPEYAGSFQVGLLLPSTFLGAGFQELDTGRLRRPCFRIASGAPVGVAQLDVVFLYDTAAEARTLDVLIGTRRELTRDDMEAPIAGWQVSNRLDVWSWERAVPQQTRSVGRIAQPGEDNPAGQGTQCWVTGAIAGSFASQRDVDGLTVLTSPRFDAAGLGVLELQYARWFTNLPSSGSSPLDDVLLVEVSNDGGAGWTTIEQTGNDNVWRTVSSRIDPLLPLTDDMRLRFTVEDAPENDLTEACIDDVVLRTVSALPTLGLWGETSAGAQPRLCVDGPGSAAYTIRSSTQVGVGVTQPGTAGLLYLEGTLLDVTSGTAGSDGRATFSWTVPAGTTLYLQVVFDEGGPEAAWSNLVTVRI